MLRHNKNKNGHMGAVSPGGQRGAIGLTTAFMVMILVAIVTAGAFVTMGSAQRGGKTEAQRSRVDAAAQAGLDWARLRALSGKCDSAATFSGSSALPGFEDLTVKTSCSADGTGTASFKLTSIACTQSVCPGTVPLPTGYAEKKLETRVGTATDQSRKYKTAAIEWLRAAGPTRLFDFEENSVAQVVHDKRPDGKTVLDLRYDVAEGAAVFPDSSPNPKTVTSNGATGTDAVFALGGGAVELDGTSASVSVAGHPDLYVPAEADFTFETWVFPRTKTGTQGLAYAGTGKFGVRVIGGVVYAGPYGGTAILNSATLLKASSWNLVSVVRQDGHLRIYINGTMATAPVAWSGDVDWTGGVTVGAEPGAYTDGYLDSTSLVVGRATRVDDFVPQPSDVASTKRVMRLGCEASANGSTAGESGFGASFLDHDSSPWRNSVTVVPTAAGDANTIYPQPGSGPYVGYGSHEYCVMSSPSYGAGYFKIGGTASSKAFGTGDFTVDGNILHANNTAAPYFIVGNWGGAGVGGWRVDKYGNYLRVQVIDGASTSVQTFTGTRVIGWNASIHFAVVRNNGRLKTFINGVADLDVPMTANIINPKPETWVGRSPQLDSYTGLTVFLDEVGILAGKAVWTKAFAAPEAADRDAYFGDTLRIGFEGSISDQSNSPRSISNQGVTLGTGGGAAVGAGYGIFNGGHLSLPANKSLEIRRGDFNVSLWVKFASGDMGREVCLIDAGAGGMLLCKTANDRWVFGRNGGTMSAESNNGVKAGVWTQVQFDRSYFNVYAYVDGTALGTSSLAGYANYYSSNVTATIGSRVSGGSALQGAMDEIEITNGRSLKPNAAPWWAPVRGNAFANERELLLLHFDELSTSQTAPIADSSVYGQTTLGSCSTLACRNEGGEAVFGRSKYGNYNLVGSNMNEYMFDKVDFTVDFRTMLPTAPSSSYMPVYVGGGPYSYAWSVTFNPDGSGKFVGNGASPGNFVQCPAGTFVAGKWMHVAVSVQGNNAYMFKDGKLCGSVTGFTRPTYVASALNMGIQTPSGYVYLDEMRILRGRGMWNADFIPPTAPYNGDGTWATMTSVEKMVGNHADVSGSPTMWTDNQGIKGMELPSGTFGRFGPVSGDDLGGAGGTVVALTNPTADAVSGAAQTRLVSLTSTRIGSSDIFALLRGDAVQTFAGASGNSAGQWNSVQSSAAQLTRDTWGMYSGGVSSAGAGSIRKDGDENATGAVWAPAMTTRTFATFGADPSGGNPFPSTLAGVALFPRTLSAVEWDGVKTGWNTGALPTELVFRSADSTVSDLVGNPVSSSGVTADATGRSVGAAWVFSGVSGQGVSASAASLSAALKDWEAEATIVPDELPGAKDGAPVLDYGAVSVRLLSDGSAALYVSGARVVKTGRTAPGMPVRVHVGRKAGYLQIGLGRNLSTVVADSTNVTGAVLTIGGAAGTGTSPYKGALRDVRLFVGKHPD